MFYRVLLAFCFVCFTLSADFESGLKAYQAGDYATALHEWQPLADQGAPHAQYNLGLMYARGQGVPQDFAKAAEYYKKAAEQGVVEAQYNLGVLYANGQGVPKDDVEAGKWFRQAAQQGDTKAAAGLASIYDEGPPGFKNPGEAETWYRKAAETGDSDAEFNLGLMYDNGQGVKQNFAEALEWYRKAAEKGNAAALCNIGILYYNGQGVSLDRLQANKYFVLAEQLGDPRASDLIPFTTNKLTPKQIAQARAEAEAWKSAHAALPAKPEPEPAAAAPVMAVADAKPAPQPADPPFEPSDQAVWTGVARVVAIGDIHGNYAQLVAVLKSVGLIDDATNWIGGKTHLVQTGDILDRGGQSRAVMDLLMKLQRQAQAGGGYVHCLLGNHEVMNLYGDLRYASAGDFNAFRGLDPSAESDSHQHPAGYFERRAALGPDGVYGKWLRSLNTEIRIDDTLFVHSGISAKYVAMPPAEMNRRVREELDNPEELQGGIVTDREGPFWYRGLAEGNEKELTTVVDATLENTGAKREAFGHSYTGQSARPRFDGKVIPLEAGGPGGFGSDPEKIGGISIENGKLYWLAAGQSPTPLDNNIEAKDRPAQ